MKETLAAIIGVITAGLLFYFNWVLGVAAWIAVAVGGYVFSKMHERSEEIKALNRRIENIHLLTAHPDTGAQPNIQRHKGNYIVVKLEDVFAEAEKLRGMLRESRNPLYLGTDDDGNPIPNHLRIDVKPIIFRHGENCNELWEEYIERAEQEISESRRATHGEYAAKAREFYQGAKYGHGDSHLRKAE